MESKFCAGCRFYDPRKMYCHYYLAGIECVKWCPIDGERKERYNVAN